MDLPINSKYIPWLLILAGAVLYIPFIGSVNLFDWDEINFAECAREMIVSGDYLRVQIDFQDFHQKPPLFIWMQALSMKLFGVNEFAARFPNAIAGILNLILLYFIGKEIRNRSFGLTWALVHGLSFLPFLYFKSGIIDPWFNLFIFSGIISYLFGLERQKNLWIALSGICIGLAVLTKGPVGLLIFGASVALAVFTEKLWWAINWKKLLSFTIPFMLVGGFWFILILLSGKPEIIWDFIDYQIQLFSTEDAGHGGPFFYHFVVLLVGCFPAAIFALRPLFKAKEDFYETTILWSLIFTLVLFSIVETKIVHYSSFCYYALSFFAAKYLVAQQSKKWVNYTLIGISSVWLLLFLNVALLGNFMNALPLDQLIKDRFALANMNADVQWNWSSFLPAILMLAAIVIAIRKSSQIAFWFATTLSILCFLILIVPRIEGYSQRAAIDYFKSFKQKDVALYPYGYKSYAHLFYSEKTPGNAESGSYLVTKITKQSQLETEFPNASLIDSKNGFLLYQLP